MCYLSKTVIYNSNLQFTNWNFKSSTWQWPEAIYRVLILKVLFSGELDRN